MPRCRIEQRQDGRWNWLLTYGDVVHTGPAKGFASSTGAASSFRALQRNAPRASVVIQPRPGAARKASK